MTIGDKSALLETTQAQAVSDGHLAYIILRHAEIRRLRKGISLQCRHYFGTGRSINSDKPGFRCRHLGL